MLAPHPSAIPMCSFKRSPPMTETEAHLLQEEIHLFGYKPEILEIDGQFHLKIRGDGGDDQVLAARLNQLRKPKWTAPR
jgi:hypothetical protein